MNNSPENNKSSDNAAALRRTVAIFGVCVCVILALSQIDPIEAAISGIADILSPVFVGVALAYVVSPMEVFFEKLIKKILPKKMTDSSRKQVSHVCGVLVAIICLVAIITLLIFLIIPEFVQSLIKLADITPGLFDKAVAWFNSHVSTETVLMQNIGKYVDSALSSLSSWIGNEFTSAVSGLWISVVSVVSFFVDFFISLIICVYALLEKEKFLAQSKKIIFAMFSARRANDILDVARHSNEMFGKFISGKIITSTIVGVLTFIFMSIMGMPYALLSAGVVAVTNVIPYFGPFIGGIPTALLILLTDFRQGVIYIVFLVILQQLEGNIIEPLIMEDQTGVSKFWITVALLVCGGVFGVAGMIFSVPLFAVLFYIIKIAVERSLAKKNMPLNSADYLNAGSYDPETGTILPIPPKPPRKKMFRKKKKKTPDGSDTTVASDENNDK